MFSVFILQTQPETTIIQWFYRGKCEYLAGLMFDGQNISPNDRTLGGEP